ncbi:MAG: 23S rRNA (pseudouridine(1915)-N(3))-methyltransferase RlmH [Fibrobacterales bacterium]
MNIELVSYGKLNSKFAIEEFAKYEKRMKPFVSFKAIELKESKRPDLKQKQEEDLREFEKKVGVGGYTLIVLSEEGKNLTSEGMAKQIEKWQLRGDKKLVFLIGAAYGISEELKKRSDFLLSLSPMTFTHDYARIIFIEQIYRWFTILKGHPYHH